MRNGLARHWPEYLMEAARLATFMISACLLATLLEHPASPARQALPAPLLRRLLMGSAMGLTAIAVIYSPWGRQSGAHLTPGVTLTLFRLGKVTPWDALHYLMAQLLGGVSGVLVARLILGPWLEDPSVNSVATVPGPAGAGLAFLAGLVISSGLMVTVLITSSLDRLARFTGLFAGIPVAACI